MLTTILLCYKVAPLLHVIFKILCHWIKHPVGLRIGILVKALLAGKANLCLEYVSIPVKMNCQMTSWSPKMLPYSVAGILYVGQTSTGEWESVILDSCTASISVIINNPLMCVLVKH